MIREHYPQQWIIFPLISYKDTCFHTARTSFPLYLLQTAVADADLTVKKLSFTGESANQKAAYKTIALELGLGRFRVHSIRFDFDSKQFDSVFFESVQFM